MIVTTLNLTAADVRAVINATTAANAAAETSGESSGIYTLGPKNLRERLQELRIPATENDAPIVQKITVTCPKTLITRSEVYFESVYNIIEAYPGIDTLLGCTVTSHREYTICVNGKARLVIAHAEFYVLPRRELDDRDFLEISGTIEKTAKMRFDYVPEIELEESLLMQPLQAFAEKIKAMLADAKIKEKVKVQLNAVLEEAFQEAASEVNALGVLPASLLEKEKELYQEAREVVDYKNFLEKKESCLEEEIEARAQERYKEYTIADQEDHAREKQRIFEKVRAKDAKLYNELITEEREHQERE